MAKMRWPQGWLAVASLISIWDGVAAQSTCSPGNITSLTQLGNHNDCEIALGNVRLGPFELPSMTTRLEVPFRRVQGSLRITNITATTPDQIAESITLNMDNLQAVRDDFTLDHLQLESMPGFSLLTEAGSLTFESLRFGRSPGAVPGSSAVYEQVAFRNMSFRDCSGLTAIDAQLLPGDSQPQMATFMAIGNSNLARINLSDFDVTPTTVVIQNNLIDLAVVFPDMVTASLVIDTISELSADKITNLGFVGSPQLQSIGNTRLSSLELPSLQSIKTELNVTDAYRLVNISFPSLTTVSASVNISSSKAETIDLSSLSAVDTLSITGGELKNISLPRNVQIYDSFTIHPEDQSVCSSLPDLGPAYSCAPAGSSGSVTAQPGAAPSAPSPGISGGDGSNASSNASPGGLSTGAKIGIGVGVGVGALLAIIAMTICFLRRRKTKARAPSSSSLKDYYTSSEPEQHDRSPVRYSKAPAVAEGYSKVPASSEGIEDSDPQDHRPLSHDLADDWSPPEQHIPSTDGRVELEEQQGPRHEMDARSLPDIDLDGDDGDDTRSLQDIERAHGQRS